MIQKIPQYWKTIVAALTPVFLIVQAAVTDDSISTQEWVGIGAAVVVAIGVFFKANAPKPLPPPEPPV